MTSDIDVYNFEGYAYEHILATFDEIRDRLVDGWEPTPGAPLVPGYNITHCWVFMRRRLP